MEVGQHCAFSTCKRLDFLPFICDHCRQVFCKEHRVPDDHECQEADTGVEKQLHSLAPGSGSHQCSLDGCRRRELMEVTCPHCGKNFCLAHRHQENHGCEALQDKAAAPLLRQHRPKDGSASGGHATATKKGLLDRPHYPVSTPQCCGQYSCEVEIVNEPRNYMLRGAKSESTSIKVALMKMKMKAEGPTSVPQSERVYYEVQLPEEYKLPKKPMFFSKEWSVGKVVDVIADTFRLRNENHRQHSQKLRLYSTSGESVAMSKPLHSLLKVLPSGSCVLLEYERPTNIET